ncbi:hypothetical protein BS78_K191600 [Paspalum vaginatum]|uniref:Uncharacterized protein n=1 Tax=Paspalum vaginatum TaxID=158149 RepID=A0A9W7X846_9POAL|nr:hypothetical protein BS78_K191600 [Paspalum vaginatum]KAJ1253772.1 hypothetical protein BS78_K191600 [Paspalum vaginatum]
MGNALLRCFEGDDHHHPQGGRARDRYPYYQPQYYGGDPPPASAAPPPPLPRPQPHHQPPPAPHGAAAPTTTQAAAGPNTGHRRQRNSGAHANGAVASPYQRSSTEDIDESSAEGLCDAKSFAKANAMLIQVPVLGTTRTFWRLSDTATRISRKLALILRNHHAVGKRLASPLQLSNIWIGIGGGSATGSTVKLRGVSFTDKGFGVERVRDDYRHLSAVLRSLIRASGGDLNRLPPDYREFLALLESDALAMEDEFLVVNNAALLPMKNRTEAFLVLHERIVKHLGRTDRAKKKRILARLPYEKDWLDTARANTKINQWVVNVNNEYKRTPGDLLRLNRNVRSHLHEYNDGDGIEEALYCEWPELLMDMEWLLHSEGELQGTDIENKFG